MTSNCQKNIEEIYYSNPIRQTSSKSKSTRNIRKNLKFTPFTHIEINSIYHNDYFETELKDNNSKEKKKIKKVSFKNEKEDYIEKKNETERIKDIKSIDIHYDELIEGLKKNPPHIRKNTINLFQDENSKVVSIKSSKSFIPERSKFLLEKTNENENNKNKESKNEDNLTHTSKNLLKFGLLLHAEEKVKNFTNTETINDFYEYTEKCMSMILDLEQMNRNEIKEKINFNFPKNEQHKKIALFDLDETLVHCIGEINSNENKKKKYQNVIEVILPSKKKVNIGINIRPYWKDALNLIKEKYHIIIFTASHQSYANAVLDFMDPKKEFTKYRLYRNDCVLTNLDGVKFYIKDLSIFDKYYNLKDIVLIDNSVLSFAYHLDNGIPIVPYYDADEDGELEILAYYLLSISHYDDLRNANKKHIRIEFYLDEARKEREYLENDYENESSSYEEEEEKKDVNNSLLESNNKEIENNKNEKIKIENNKNNNNENYNNENNNNENNNNESNNDNNKVNVINKVSFNNNSIPKKENPNTDNKQNFKKKFMKYNTLRDIHIFNGYKRSSIRKRTNIGLDVRKMWGDLKKELNIN